jgi:hypothetical protein
MVVDASIVPFEWKLETKHLEEHFDEKGEIITMIRSHSV